MLLVVLFVLAVVMFVFMRLLLAKQRLSLRNFFIFYVLATLGVAMIYLGGTGRLHWLFVIGGSALPFTGTLMRWGLRFWRTAALLKGLRSLMGQAGQTQGRGTATGKKKSTGQTSEVNTDYIRMVLDHDTGLMFGEAVKGRFAGSQLSDLSLTELKALYSEISNDVDSTNVLEAYLDREHSQWRDEETNGTHETQYSLTEQEALDILGLEQGASENDIKLAHRRIIQKLHPDRGGSTFLASQVNDAKDLLLKK